MGRAFVAATSEPDVGATSQRCRSDVAATSERCRSDVADDNAPLGIAPLGHRTRTVACREGQRFAFRTGAGRA